MKFYTISIAFLSLVLLSCQSNKYLKSDQVEQRVIFQQYHLSFDAENNHLRAQATFSENNPSGKTIELTKKSEVFFNDTKMEGYYQDSRFSYFTNLSIEKPKILQFKYINNEDIVYSNTLTLRPLSISTPNGFTLQRSSAASMPYAGAPFSDEESLECTFYQGDKPIQTFELESPSGKYISISSSMINTLKPGKYSCQFSRTISSSNVKSTDRGGWYECEYISKKIEIIIVD